MYAMHVFNMIVVVSFRTNKKNVTTTRMALQKIKAI